MPSLNQAQAQERELLLEFAKQHGVLEKYLPRLQANPKQQETALDEIRVAWWLASNGFPPLAGTWNPNGGTTSDGEFAIKGPAGAPITVEVKSRSWQSEISGEEKLAGRLEQRKRVRSAGAMPVADPIRAAIDKAYPKFKGQTPSLLVINGEDFRVSLSELAEERAGQALYSTTQHGYFTDSRYENLGGLGIFGPDHDGQSPVQYGMELYVNAFALPTTRLPRDFIQAFNGIRLWDDPTDPDQVRKAKRWVGDDRLDRSTILRVLRAKRTALERYGVKRLSLFGSAARGDNDPASDLDFVVDLSPKTFANYMGLKEYLESLFGCRIDLLLPDAIKPALRESILSECVHAA